MDSTTNEFRLTHLPSDCEPTTLGYPKGSDRQYRGPNGLHVRQYGPELIAHYDKIDPRYDLFGHGLVEAPVATAAAVGVGTAAAITLAGGPHAAWFGLAAGLASLIVSEIVDSRD